MNTLQIKLNYPPVVNYSMQQNHAPVIRCNYHKQRQCSVY